METQGSGGGYGGTGSVGGLCQPTNSDMAASQGDVLSRLAVIESLLAQILGLNVSALSVSDISQDLGNILSGSFSPQMLVDAFNKFGRMNVWAVSGQDTFINSGGSSGSISSGERIDHLGQVVGFSGGGQTSTSVGSVAGIRSAQVSYRTFPVHNNGGFYFTGRFGMYDFTKTISEAPTGCRFYAGMNVPIAPNVGNVDDPTPNYASTYIMFQFSAPRGDTTFKVITRDSPVYLVPGTQTIVDTGIPALLEHWYDMSFRCEAGANEVSWTITDIITGASAAGTVAVPQVYHGPFEPDGQNNNSYGAGATIYNSTAGGFRTILIHHIWAQALDVDTF